MSLLLFWLVIFYFNCLTFFFFFFNVNQEPFIVKLHDRMTKLDLRAKQPQLQEVQI